MRELKALCFASLLVVSTMQAAAQDYYIAGFGGVSLKAEQDLTLVDPFMIVDPQPSLGPRALDPGSWMSDSVSYKKKPLFGGAIGARFEFGPLMAFRAELEGSRRKNVIGDGLGQVRPASAGGSLQSDFIGQFSATSGLANFYWEPHISRSVRPYVGGGVGVSRIRSNVRARNIAMSSVCPAAIPGTLLVDAVEFDGQDTSFVWQLIGGVEAPVAGKLSVFTDARYFKTRGGIRHDGEFGFNVNALCQLPLGQAQINAPVNGDYEEISVLAGIRISF
jgi:opacity protein-like surface antigen